MNNNIKFQKKVHALFKERCIGEILKLEPSGKKKHYIKFRPFDTVWFQQLGTFSVDVDSVDFENNTVTGFIPNSIEFNDKINFFRNLNL